MKIGIIGLGLIGGSILKALRGKGHKLYAVSKSSADKVLEFASASADIKIVKDCDVVFVCSPMREAKAVLKSLEGVVLSQCIVADVCSLKKFLKDDYKFNYIGSHPMAGTEFSGFEASFATLFNGAKWVITKRNEILENLIKEMGAKPVFMAPNDHDKAAAAISHLPMLISFALFDSVKTDEAKLLASSGFRDTTRLALSSAFMAEDMLELNDENIQNCLDEFIKSIEYLKKLNGDERICVLRELAQKRAQLYDENGKNRFDKGNYTI